MCFKDKRGIERVSADAADEEDEEDGAYKEVQDKYEADKDVLDKEEE
jgi:hypothetical protein